MPDAPVKKRFKRARGCAKRELESDGYFVVISGDGACLIGFRDDSVRIIRVCLDEITGQDRRVLKTIAAPTFCRREIWCRKPGATTLEKEKI